jgi:hypothetical protein
VIHICSWCHRVLGILPGRLGGRAAHNYGICPACLLERLSALDMRRKRAPAEKRATPVSDRAAA